ncbi:guanine nucleotide-binding protein G(s) subunit alpha isoforms XLas-like [Zingiber officinale]|uniref:Uncharacterized protein n=1 Tax=Zingiber officinale TaxID=94328 RepID=A0A8J5KV48_ZINOF|nr:guanine nucleotide-binding protein G(s) subunit alpha isoforms XLas-like [Zingiber officinale]KAG6497379.1 hypothetical protein ZIOFF_045278 [Zingiber officinale]
MGNCAAKPLALDDAPLPLEKLPSMNDSSVDGDAYKEEEEAAATAKSTSPEHEPLLKSEEVDESNKNDASEAQKDDALKNDENVVSETHTLASEPAEENTGVMDHEITDETTPANPQDTVVVTPQDLTKDEDEDAAFDKPKDPEAIIIENAALSEANVEPEDSEAKVQVEAQEIDAIVKEPNDQEATTIIATPQENPAPLEAQENDATKASKEKKKGDVFHTLFTMYNNLVKKP